jgi:hypothetical protein
VLPVIAGVVLRRWLSQVPKYVTLNKLASTISGIEALWSVQVTADGTLLHLSIQLAAGVHPSNASHLVAVDEGHVSAVNKAVLDVRDVLRVKIQHAAQLDIRQIAEL